MGRILAEKEEVLRREEAMEEDREPLLTCHREDAYNQVKKRSKIDIDLIVNNDRQNCIKNNQKNINNRTNHSNNRNMTLKVKRTEKSNDQIRRSPRSPVIIKNSTVSRIRTNCRTNNNQFKRTNTGTVSKPIENGNQTNTTNVLNTSRRSR